MTDWSCHQRDNNAGKKPFFAAVLDYVMQPVYWVRNHRGFDQDFILDNIENYCAANMLTGSSIYGVSLANSNALTFAFRCGWSRLVATNQ